MSTKATLITALNSFISAVGLVTKARHTDANELFVDELYPDFFIENTSGTLEITDNIGDLAYNLYFNKQGNIVSVIGTIKNNGIKIVPSGVLFNFTNSNFTPTGMYVPAERQMFKSDDCLFVWTGSGVNGGLRALNSISGGQIIYIDTEFITQA